MPSNSITCVITFHNEGLLAHQTLLSLERCRQYAEIFNIEVYFICTLDQSDVETTRIVETHLAIRSSDKIFKIDVGDLGLSRNYAIQQATTEYISIHDGDDYYNKELLKQYIDYIQTIQEQNIILHPQVGVNFDGEHTIDIRSGGECNELNIGFYHSFPSCLFTYTQNLKKIPYYKKNREFIFAYEELTLDLDFIYAGYKHYRVPQTIYFYRRKIQNSLFSIENKLNSVVRPLPFYNTFYKNLHSNLVVLDSSNQKKEIQNKLAHYFLIVVKKIYWFVHKYILGFLGHSIRDKIFIVLLRFLQKKIPQYILQKQIPPYIIESLQDIGLLVDSNLLPNEHFLHRYTIANYFSNISASKIGITYSQIYSKIADIKFDFCFIVPWIKVGGADYATLCLVNYLKEQNKNVLIITTEPSYSILQDGKNDNFFLLSIGSIISILPQYEKEMLLMRLLLQVELPIVHIINSVLAYDTLKKYGKSLLYKTKFYISVFSEFKDKRNFVVRDSFAIWYLRDCNSYITKIFSDNQTYLDNLVKDYGVDKRKLFCLYHPVNINFTNSPLFCKGAKVLWASRLDYEKRIDILLPIVQAMPHIHFDVYGYSLWSWKDKVLENQIKALHKCKNVTMKGKYNGFVSIPHQEYFCFLYTTSFDGMPNVLLEAVGSGLPVLAPNIGGISELIINNETGILVQNNEDIGEYIKGITFIKENSHTAKEYWQKAYSILQQRHTQEYFEKQLKEANY